MREAALSGQSSCMGGGRRCDCHTPCRPGDSCSLLPMNQQVIHECWVEGVGRDRVTLKISEKAKQASVSSRNRCSLRFVLSRTHMREMHYAVDQLDLGVVFPVPQ